MMLLTVAFARLASAQELTIFNGYTVAVETARVVGDKLLIDGSGNGNSTLGTFTFTYHFELSLLSKPGDGRGKGTAQLAFANGDTWCSKINALGIDTGVGGFGNGAYVTELHNVTKATGQFAGAVVQFTLERTVELATGNTSGSIRGNIVIATP